jgi:hypothetical protein
MPFLICCADCYVGGGGEGLLSAWLGDKRDEQIKSQCGSGRPKQRQAVPNPEGSGGAGALRSAVPDALLTDDYRPPICLKHRYTTRAAIQDWPSTAVMLVACATDPSAPHVLPAMPPPPTLRPDPQAIDFSP